MIINRLPNESADSYGGRVLSFLLDTGAVSVLDDAELLAAEDAYDHLMCHPGLASIRQDLTRAWRMVLIERGRRVMA